MKVIDGGVTAAKGFQAAAAAAGIKYKDRTDMALIYSEKPCKAAGTFTTNLVKAAPVKWDRAIVESKRKPQAVIVNSGIANACTGEEGMKYCEETAKEAACVLGGKRACRFHRSDWYAASDGPGEIGNQNAGRGKEQQQRKGNRGSKSDHDNGYKEERSGSYL